MMTRWLIVQTGSTLAQIAARRGDFAEWFRHAAGLSRHEVEVARIDQAAVLPPAHNYTGVLVTGSASMVTEQLDWSERAAAWLAAAVHRDSVPLLGVCYGHQLIAHGLGGEVGWNPRGRQIGTRWLTVTGAAQSDPLFQSLPPCFRAQTTHRQSVLQLPAQAQVLASSAMDAHQALRFGQRAWGVQFHPEFSAGVMASYIRGRSAQLRDEQAHPQALLQDCGPAPQARRLLRRFVTQAQAGRI